MSAQPNLVTREVIRELFLVACESLRDEDGETTVHDSLLYDMAISQAKALNAMNHVSDDECTDEPPSTAPRPLPFSMQPPDRVERYLRAYEAGVMTRTEVRSALGL